MKKLFWALFAALAVLACTPSNDNGEPITFSATSFSLSAEGTAQTFFVVAKDGKWQATPKADWLHITPDSGSGSLKVSVSADPNPDNLERSSFIDFTMPGVFNGIISITVTQAAGTGESGEGGGGSGEGGGGSGEGGGGDAPSAGQPGWAELPVLDYSHHTEDNLNYYTLNSRQELYITHHRAQDSHGAVVRNYTACWNSTYKCPEWVAAPRHRDYEGGSSSSRSYQFNPDMPKSVQYGATSGSGTYNRGHMLGAAERSGCKNGNPSMFSQVNYITNISPQNATWFNTGSGGWNILEDWVDGQVCPDTLYIVTGCYFEDFTDGYGNKSFKEVISGSYMGTTGVQKPTMQYYVLLRTKSGNSGKNVKDCTAAELKCAAFVRAHDSGTKGQSVTAKELMSVADIEKITGFKYFANVPNAPKNDVSASDWGLQ